MVKAGPIRDRMNNREKLHHYYLVDLMRQLEFDLHDGREIYNHIPLEWEDIATQPATPVKTRITLRVDGDVAKFFRAMGTGYQTRMNAVLRAFMLSKISGVIKGAERFEKYVTDVEYKDRPSIGDIERMMGE